MELNCDRVCRLCMSSSTELLPIFPTTSSDDTEPSKLISKIKDCVAVEINESDELPTDVCNKCMDNVNNWHIFKSVCERTQVKLLYLLNNDGSQLEEVQVKDEPDEAYDDSVVIDASYPDSEAAESLSKVRVGGPPILASLGLTPRSEKTDSEKGDDKGDRVEEFSPEDREEYYSGEEEYDDDEMLEEKRVTRQSNSAQKIPNMPEVSITVMRPSGETLHARQGIQEIASKDCLVCRRTYRYSHNARRHELAAHNFDRYTSSAPKSKIKPNHQKLRPNPFNPKSRLMPNPINHKIQFMNKLPPGLTIHPKALTPNKPIPIKTPKDLQNNLPYPLRIKALKDLQIKKTEPHILKTLLTATPEVLISEPEILDASEMSPQSPETLISEPEISSFQVETILTEPNDDQEYEENGSEIDHQNQPYDTVDMESDNEIEIARQRDNAIDEDNDDLENDNEIDNENDQNNVVSGEENLEDHNDDDLKDNQVDPNSEVDDTFQNDNHEENKTDMKVDEIEDNEGAVGDQDVEGEDGDQDNEDADMEPLHIVPIVEVNEDVPNNLDISEVNEEELDESAEVNDAVDGEEKTLVTDKIQITEAQREFIQKYRNVIEQINTQRCLCCDKEYPRRKAVIQHLQKNGLKVPKHTCYNCIVTFSHIGALLSHMRANVCTDVWKVIYEENGFVVDTVAADEIKDPKVLYKDILNARSYACKLCPAKFQLKQFIMKHVLEFHEDGQSMVPKKCVHCGIRFKDRSLGKKHIRRGECTVYISCDLCSEKCSTLQEFSEHALAVHAGTDQSESLSKRVDERPTDCPICGKKNNSYPCLVKHLRTIHQEDKPNHCQHCEAKFDNVSDLNNHIYKEHSDRNLSVDMSIVKEEAEEYHYSCTECNAIFETVDAWTDHQVAEHNQVAHHCDQCEKKFLRPSELAEHKNTHLRVKFYSCSFCNNSYGTPLKLSTHIQQAHPGASSLIITEEFYCEICNRAFKSRQAYSNHMRIHTKVPTINRKPGGKSFAPQIVGKPIKQFSMMQQGFVTFKPNSNVPNAPYSCDICGKGFMHKKNIWKHKKVLHADLAGDRNDSEENTMNASTEEDEYNADENGTMLSTPQFDSFNFADIQASSLLSQPAEKPMFACELCFKKFPLKDSLWRHKRAKHGISGGHDPDRPAGGRASCTICKINFTDKKSYYRHRKTVHKSSTQMCKICGKPLSSTLELYEHLKSAHARELLGYQSNQGSSKADLSQDVDPDYENDQDDSADPAAEYQARYPCDTCGKQFVGLLALQNHQCINQLASTPATYDCEICNKSYASIAALKSHRGWHLRSPDGKAAANNTSLWMPQGKMGYSKYGKQDFIDPSQLAHVQLPSSPSIAAAAKRRLPPEVEVTVVNPNKKMRSDDFDMDQNSNSAENKYCNICDKEFTKRAAYQRHMEEVHQPNSVFCPVCNKSFTRKSTLLVHMRKHYDGGEGSSGSISKMEDDTSTCDICGAQFTNEQLLRLHKERHHAEDSGESEDDGSVNVAPGEFTCGQCGDGVATPRDLIAHRSMHATPTKFLCNICKVYFARAIDLSSHTRARHSDNEKVFFPCAMCDRFYMNKKSLQRHIELAH